MKICSHEKQKAFTENNAFQIERSLKLSLVDQAIKYAFGMCQQTVTEETKKTGQYSKIIFIEFVEFLCRILYIKFKISLESNLLDSSITHAANDKTHIKPDSLSLPASHLYSANSSQMNTERKGVLQPKDEEQRREAHQKHLYTFKEYCCSILIPFFDTQGLDFIDPDVDPILSESNESDFVYDLPSGYNSGDSNNPS